MNGPTGLPSALGTRGCRLKATLKNRSATTTILVPCLGFWLRFSLSSLLFQSWAWNSGRGPVMLSLRRPAQPMSGLGRATWELSCAMCVVSCVGLVPTRMPGPGVGARTRRASSIGSTAPTRSWLVSVLRVRRCGGVTVVVNMRNGESLTF